MKFTHGLVEPGQVVGCCHRDGIVVMLIMLSLCFCTIQRRQEVFLKDRKEKSNEALQNVSKEKLQCDQETPLKLSNCIPLLLPGFPAWSAGHPRYSGSLEARQPVLSPAECVWLFHRLTKHPLERNRKWMKERREWVLHGLMKSTHTIHQVSISNTCISVCSRIWASSIHASTSSGYCSVTFFKCPWKTEDNYATSKTHSLFKKNGKKEKEWRN